MKYKKPKVIAKNLPTGAYAAGCPEWHEGFYYECLECERSK
ncbi:hypothetical protein [Prevotella sp. HCN-7019]|jgi:hypothetical protein